MNDESASRGAGDPDAHGYPDEHKSEALLRVLDIQAESPPLDDDFADLYPETNNE